MVDMHTGSGARETKKRLRDALVFQDGRKRRETQDAVPL